MSGLVNQILQSIMLGGLYAIYALGLAISLGVMRFINVSHGDLIVLCSFVFLTLTTTLGLPPLLAAILLLPFGMALGWVLQRSLVQRAVDRGELQIILVTFGLSVVIQNALQGVYGADSQKVQGNGIEAMSFPLSSDINIGVLPLAIFGSAILLIVLLDTFLYRTATGTAIRAIADNMEAAKLNGLSPVKLFSIAMAIVGLTIAVAGGFMAVWTNFDPTSGPSRLLIAFEVVVLGGLGSFWGVLVGGILIAGAQTIGASYDSALQVLGGHIVFLLIFLLRPQGLFPRY